VSEHVLVAFVTAGGATERYANAVAEALRTSGVTVDVANLKRDRVDDLSAYSTVVVGTGVRMGLVYMAAKRFLGRKDLGSKRVAVFLSSGVAIQDRAKAREAFLTPLVKRLGLTPVSYTALPGAVPGRAGTAGDKVDLELARSWVGEVVAGLAGGERSS
jgi:menaquinone-dependent protoporphyrinogen IX oxidase